MSNLNCKTANTVQELSFKQPYLITLKELRDLISYKTNFVCNYTPEHLGRLLKRNQFDISKLGISPYLLDNKLYFILEDPNDIKFIKSIYPKRKSYIDLFSFLLPGEILAEHTILSLPQLHELLISLNLAPRNFNGFRDSLLHHRQALLQLGLKLIAVPSSKSTRVARYMVAISNSVLLPHAQKMLKRHAVQKLLNKYSPTVKIQVEKSVYDFLLEQATKFNTDINGFLILLKTTQLNYTS